MAIKGKELFCKINEVAVEFAKTHSVTKRSELISLVASEIIDESNEQRKNRLKQNVDVNCVEDYAWIFGICAPKDLIISILCESLGEKINKSGEFSKSCFDPDKGAKYTTYFINLLKLRSCDEKYKSYNEPMSLDIYDDFDDDKIRPIYVREPHIDFDEVYDNCHSGISIDEHILVQTAGFFTELIKSKKTFPTTRGIYSLLFVNFTRKPNGAFPDLNNFSRFLFEPADMEYINKMTKFQKQKRQDFLSLSYSELSQYVYDNKLDEAYSPKETKIRILKDKSISLFYEIKEATLSYQKKNLLHQFAVVLESNY